VGSLSARRNSDSLHQSKLDDRTENGDPLGHQAQATHGRGIAHVAWLVALTLVVLLACMLLAPDRSRAVIRVLPPVLIINNGGDHGDAEPAKNLATFLGAAEYSPTTTKRLPANLSGYTAIWFVGTNPIPSSSLAPLQAYVQSGGGLYLTGEGPCCESLNRSDEQLVRRLVMPAPYKIGDGQVVTNPSLSRNLVNPNSIDGIMQLPTPVRSWQPFGPGAMFGVQFNELTYGYQAGGILPAVTGAAWTGSEVVGGKGHVVLMMDVNWLESRYGNLPEAKKTVANMQRFLAGTAQGSGVYVALGDSFSSGHGNPPFDPAGGDCDRSLSDAYPDMIAKDLKLSASNHAFRFQACSGAITDDVTGQASALGANTLVVTLTAGGDDVHFKDVLIDCTEVFLTAVTSSSGSNDCTAQGARHGPSELRNAEKNITQLGPKLEQLYSIVQRHAPSARGHIYVLGYPDVFPPSASSVPLLCPEEIFMKSESITWLGQLQEKLDRTIETAAHNRGLTYVDPNRTGKPYSFLRHDVCSGHSWFHLPVSSALVLKWEAAYHPTRTGQEQLANALRAAGANQVKTSDRAAGPASAGALPQATEAGAQLAPAGNVKLRANASNQDSPSRPESGITGIVTSTAGHPLSGIEVTATSVAKETQYNGETDADGTYLMSGLPAGEYILHFDPGARLFEPQWYSGQAEESAAQPVTVVAGETREGISAALEQTGAMIEGHVRNSAGQPLAGVEVTASQEGVNPASTVTDGNGYYAIEGLSAATYFVAFNDEPHNHLVEYFHQQPFEQVTRLHVESNAVVSGIDTVLQNAGKISGQIRGPHGEPVPGVDIEADAVNGSFQGAVASGPDGSYTIANLPPENYTLRFEPVESNYLGQYYDGQATAQKAKRLRIQVSQTREHVDATLASGASISGTVTSAADKHGVENVPVYASSASSTTRASVTGADGTYTIAGLPEGAYTIRYQALAGNFVGQYYLAASSQDTAEPITLTAGAGREHVDAQLATGATISGHVTQRGTDQPVAGVEVNVISTDGTGERSIATTSEDGSYSVTGLPAGSYDVQFQPNQPDQLGEFYDGKSSADAADAVTVGEGGTTAGVDAQLVSAATVDGIVTDAGTGEPVAGVEVDAASSEGGTGGSATSGLDGHYTVIGLAAGRYTVHFQASTGDYAPQYYSAKVDAESPDPVDLSADETTTADAQLTSGASITGTVVDGSRNPLRNVHVKAIPVTDGASGGSTTTAFDGSYAIAGLAADTYIVQFEPQDNHVGEYYERQSSPEGATQIDLADGASRQDVNATLEQGATISGTVSDAGSGAGLDHMTVFAYATQCSTGQAAALTGSEGSYTLEGLPPGSYHLIFNPDGGSHEARPYSGLVTVDVGGSVSGIDVGLASATRSEAAPFACETQPTPEPPEIGTCTKMVAGEYATVGCDTGRLGNRTGKFEWTPGVAHSVFTGSGGAVKLETPAKIKLACTGQTATGEYAGTKGLANVVLRLHGCTGFGQSCTSEGAAAGEIATAALEGRLGWESMPGKAVGVDLAAPSDGAVATLQCGDSQLKWRGSIIATAKAGRMASVAILKFKATKGHQIPEHFEGLPTDVLEQQLNLTGIEPLGVTASLSLRGEEPVEINVSP
jgi:hypothetical protein